MAGVQQKTERNELLRVFKMKVNFAYRYELKPNYSQMVSLGQHAGTARFAYNWGLNQRITLYEKEKKSTNAIEQHRQLNVLKESEFPWMYEVSKCAPQEALRDLDRAFQNFFRGLKEGKAVGFPAFKRKGVRDSFRLTGTIKVIGKKIQLPRVGTIRLKETPKVYDKILSATITREADRWYVSVTVEAYRPDPAPVQGDAVAIDMGLTCFATLSTGDKIIAPKPLAKNMRRLKKVSRKHSKKVHGSKNRKKSAIKLSRLHRKNRNIRKDFLHKTTTNLAKTKSTIVLEDLNVKGMVNNKQVSRSISDAGWREFRCMLEYKTKWYGSTLVIAPRFYPSSKTCSQCGHVLKELPLAVRQWECPECQSNHDRDVNAAMNLLKFSTGSSPGIYACGDTSDGTSRQLVSHVSLKQEVTNGIFVHKL
jgi:putative transposase